MLADVSDTDIVNNIIVNDIVNNVALLTMLSFGISSVLDELPLVSWPLSGTGLRLPTVEIGDIADHGCWFKQGSWITLHMGKKVGQASRSILGVQAKACLDYASRKHRQRK